MIGSKINPKAYSNLFYLVKNNIKNKPRLTHDSGIKKQQTACSYLDVKAMENVWRRPNKRACLTMFERDMSGVKILSSNLYILGRRRSQDRYNTLSLNIDWFKHTRLNSYGWWAASAPNWDTWQLETESSQTHKYMGSLPDGDTARLSFVKVRIQ